MGEDEGEGDSINSPSPPVPARQLFGGGEGCLSAGSVAKGDGSLSVGGAARGWAKKNFTELFVITDIFKSSPLPPTPLLLVIGRNQKKLRVGRARIRQQKFPPP